jgi:dihydrofolate synthase/folylpolyglutamate synthase
MAVPISASAQAIEQWLAQAVDHERAGTFRDIRLDRIRAFLDLLPPPPAPCTVAGTKGKGSTVRLMECALLAGGRMTVAFTSPHVHSVLERWRIDGVPAPAAAISAHAEQVAALEERHRLPLTYFERTFAIACLLAASRPGTAFLCEVGLGGRLDCANALDCAVAVLTQLSHDHRDVLGPTLHHLAREKLAVSRPGRPLVIGPQSPAAALAIWRELGRGSAAACWVQPARSSYQLALAGAHQQDNAATAAAALRLFAPGLAPAALRAGFAGARLAARCQELIAGGRRLLIDGAHNGASVEATLAVAASRLGAGWRLILGLGRDKEVDEVLAALPPALTVVRCGYRSPRARGAQDWPAAAAPWRWFDNVAEAIAAQPPGLDLCITGSFYLAGEALTGLGAAGALPG